MKRWPLTVIALSLVLASCKRNEVINPDIKHKLFVFFDENIRDIDSTVKLDSLNILQIDTITKKQVIEVKMEELITARNEALDRVKEMQEKIRSNLQLVRLSGDLLDYGSRSLYENYREDAIDDSKKVRVLLHQDSLIAKRYDSLALVREKADSSGLLYYQVKCLWQFHRKDLSVTRDTVFAFLDPSKNIVKRDQLTWK